ncbi:MAG: tyrosine-type recombinase/integrase [Actinobacteria bacterium]|nr:tyrosine-type recombinase/integrase [Actinomycetota bacterium]
MNNSIKYLLDDYQDYLSYSKGLSKNSVDAYRTDLLNLFKENSVTNISSDALNKLIKLISTKEYSPNTKKRKVSVLRQFVKWYNFRENSKTVILEDVTIKSGQRLPETLSITHIEQLINFHDKETFISKRNKAIIDFMYSTGCRVSELCNVKIADIDFDEDYIQLTGKGSKQRIVPIGSKLKTNLLSYLDLKLIKDISNNPFLFISRTDNPLERTAIFRIIKSTALKTSTTLNIHPHTLRHSAATHMLEAGCDLRTLQEYLGHSSVSTTQIYTKLTKEFLNEVFNESHPRA